MSTLITTATNSYVTTFASYSHQFIEWGKYVFITLVTFNVAWLGINYAFGKDSISDSMADFLKKFIIMLIFFTMMTNPAWLMQLADMFNFMGHKLTNIPLDPSSIITNGLVVSDRVTSSIVNVSLWKMGLGMFMIGIVNLVILLCFFSVALDLAVTLITNAALVVVSSFFLGFAGLGATSTIARQTIDVILANCVKLLGIYLVVGASTQTINRMVTDIPVKFDIESGSLEIYYLTALAAGLFWLLAKHLPNQLARIVTNALTETHGTNAAAIAMAAIHQAKALTPIGKAAGKVAEEVAKIAGSVGYNAASHFGANKADGLGAAMLKSAAGAVVDSAKSSFGSLSDNYKNVASKLSGGQGTGIYNPETKQREVAGFSERMYDAAQNTKAQSVSNEIKGASTHPLDRGEPQKNESNSHDKDKT